MSRVMPVEGTYFEDLEIGDRIITLGRTVTETDVVNFSGVSGDFNPLHTDAEFAADDRFGQRLAHGLCGLSLASGLIVRTNMWEGSIVAFLGLRWRFEAPLFLGDTMHVELEVTSLRETSRGDAGIVTYGIEIKNQRDEVTQRGDWDIMLKRRSPSS